MTTCLPAVLCKPWPQSLFMTFNIIKYIILSCVDHDWSVIGAIYMDVTDLVNLDTTTSQHFYYGQWYFYPRPQIQLWFYPFFLNLPLFFQIEATVYPYFRCLLDVTKLNELKNRKTIWKIEKKRPNYPWTLSKHPTRVQPFFLPVPAEDQTSHNSQQESMPAWQAVTGQRKWCGPVGWCQ